MDFEKVHRKVCDNLIKMDNEAEKIKKIKQRQNELYGKIGRDIRKYLEENEPEWLGKYDYDYGFVVMLLEEECEFMFNLDTIEKFKEAVEHLYENGLYGVISGLIPLCEEVNKFEADYSEVDFEAEVNGRWEDGNLSWKDGEFNLYRY